MPNTIEYAGQTFVVKSGDRIAADRAHQAEFRAAVRDRVGRFFTTLTGLFSAQSPSQDAHKEEYNPGI